MAKQIWRLACIFIIYLFCDRCPHLWQMMLMSLNWLKEVVADPLSKTSAVWFVESSGFQLENCPGMGRGGGGRGGTGGI